MLTGHAERIGPLTVIGDAYRFIKLWFMTSLMLSIIETRISGGMSPQMTSVNALKPRQSEGKLLSSSPVHVGRNYTILTLQFALRQVGCGERARQRRKLEESPETGCEGEGEGEGNQGLQIHQQ